MKKIGIALFALIVLTGGTLLVFRPEVERALTMATLFTGAEQYENFNRMADLMPHTVMRAAPEPHRFPAAESGLSLPDSFDFEGETLNVERFLAETDTSALLVLRGGEVLFEQYWLTGGEGVNWLSMSVAKSFVSAAIGVAVGQSLIDIQLPITDYVPELAGSAYDGVRIKDILQMSSGAAWNEDYSDPFSDINRMGRLMALGGSVTEFVASMDREYAPGSRNRYNSMDTQALGLLLAAATGESIATYMERTLWHPLGMASDGYWLTDDHGVELAFFGLNATARDYARLGELFRLQGVWQGRQLLSADWVAASTTADAPHLQPGVHEDFPLGYGYQWWLPESIVGEFMAIGVYNQFIYVDPSRELVIVKLSAYSDYAVETVAKPYRELESVEFFRAIGAVAVP